MRIWFAVAVALVLGTAPAQAQPLPSAACDTLKQLGAKFGSLNRGSDDDRRRFALIVAQQFKFTFPGQGWGSKAAGEGRPQTKDVVAQQAAGLQGWDIVNGTTREVRCDVHVDLPGQRFIEVTATDHLGGLPPPPPPVDDVARALGALSVKLDQISDQLDAIARQIANQPNNRALLEAIRAAIQK